MTLHLGVTALRAYGSLSGGTILLGSHNEPHAAQPLAGACWRMLAPSGSLSARIRHLNLSLWRFGLQELGLQVR